jgi:membrane protein YqaA with SNARE-associated domain
MPDPATTLALLLVVALVESSRFVRVPIGLLLAIALLASGTELVWIALIGASGVAIGRIGLALQARFGLERALSDNARAQRAALGEQLKASKAYTRITFVMAALPGIPATFVFPLLGSMRGPLWPALLGTIAGRTPLLVLTTWIFQLIGEGFTSSTDEAVQLLGIVAVMLLIVRLLNQIDWAHREETGQWRMSDATPGVMRWATFSAGSATVSHSTPTDFGADDIVEGEIVGEEIVGEEQIGDSQASLVEGDSPPASPADS